jgi:hypothetical protein
MTILTVGPTAGTGSATLWPLVLFSVIGIVWGTMLITVPRRKYPSLFIKHFGWLPVTLGVATYPLLYWTARQVRIVPASQYFEISAQVLPVLLLAAVVDVRRSSYLKSYQLALPIIVVFLGEIAALNILAFGENGQGNHLQATAADFAVVGASLSSTTAALIFAVLADLQESSRKRYRQMPRRDRLHRAPRNRPTRDRPLPKSPTTGSTT